MSLAATRPTRARNQSSLAIGLSLPALQPLTFATTVAVMLTFAFPKAGFYLAGIPITFGYVAMTLLAAAQVMVWSTSDRRVDYRLVTIGFLLCALSAVLLAAFGKHGYRSTSELVGVLASSLAVPILALLSGYWVLDHLGREATLKTLRWCLMIVAVYGLASFFIFNATGIVVGIPFITVTGMDFAAVTERHNMRASVTKMFSTYHNGNLLGLNLLLWAPLVVSTRTTRAMFRSVCVLSLSRSVWVGMCVYEMIVAARTMRPRRWIATALMVAGLAVVAWMVTIWMEYDPFQFFTDREFGGRLATLKESIHGDLAGRTGWASESFYASAYYGFGAVGLLLYAAIWSLPAIAGNRDELALQSRIAMGVYLFVALVDGAFILVPTQMIFWFVAAVALHPSTMLDRHPDVLGE